MSRNLKIFTFATVIFAITGVMNDATVMFVLAGVGATVILVCYLLSALSLSRLDAELIAPPGNATAGSEQHPRLLIRSTGNISLSSTGVELGARNLTIDGIEIERRALLPNLPPGSSVDVDFELRPPARGRYRLGPPTIVDSDPIGMFEQRRECGEATELLVFPRTWDVPRVATWDPNIGRRVRRGLQGRQDRGEFRGIREHIAGDDLRHVHWKATAHIGELSVKEYEPLRHDIISIHLDLAADNHYGRGLSSTLETAISAAASLARGGLAEQRSVSLMGAGLPPEVGRPGSGQAHLHRIMTALAEAQQTAADFTHSLARQLRSVPRGASLFVITTGIEQGLVQTLSMSASTAASVMLLVVEGDVRGGNERYSPSSRQVAEAAHAADIHVGVLRSPADVGDALTAAMSGTRRVNAEVI